MNSTRRESFKSFRDAGHHMRRQSDTGGEQGMNQFFKRDRSRSQPPVVEQKGNNPRHDSKSALRARNLNLLMSTAEIAKDQLAEALEMPIPRVSDLVEGVNAVSQEVAQHIEAMLELDPGWLDHKHNGPVKLGDKTRAILRGEAVSSLNAMAQELHDEEQAYQQELVALQQNSETVAAAPQVAEIPASKETAMATASAEDIQTNRRQNFEYLTSTKGTKAKIARMMGCSAGHITLLLSGGRTFLDETASNLETMLGLPKNWMDKTHAPTDVPEKALFAIHHEKAVAEPALSTAGRRGRPLTRVQQMKEAEAAGANGASEAKATSSKEAGTTAPSTKTATKTTTAAKTTSEAKGTPTPAKRPTASAQASKQAPTGKTAPTVKAPSPQVAERAPAANEPSASVAETVASAATAAVEVASSAASVATPVAAEPPVVVPAPAIPQPATATVVYQTESGLSPMVEALVQTISAQARAGVLNDAMAYRLLGQIMGF